MSRRRCSWRCKKNGFLYTAKPEAVVFPQPGALSARPLRGRHLLHLRLRPTRAATSATSAATCWSPACCIDPRSKMDGSTPELRETEHYFLDLGKLQEHGGRFPQGARVLLAPERAAPIAGADPGGRAARAADHPRPGLGHPGARWRAGRANACTCGSRRSSATFPLPSSGAACTGQPDAWRDWWQNPTAANLLLHRQGQYPLPCHHLAGGTARRGHAV